MNSQAESKSVGLPRKRRGISIVFRDPLGFMVMSELYAETIARGGTAIPAANGN